MDVNERRADGVGWEIPLSRGGYRARFSEERSGPDEESEDSAKEIDRVDDWLRSPRRGLSSRYTEVPVSSRSGSLVERHIRPDDQRETSGWWTTQLGSRSTLERRESDPAKRKDSTDLEDSSYYPGGDRPRRPRRGPSDPPSDESGDEIPSGGSKPADCYI